MIRVSLLWQRECQKRESPIWEDVNRYSSPVPGNIRDRTYPSVRKFEKWERIGIRAQARYKRAHHKAYWLYWKFNKKEN